MIARLSSALRFPHPSHANREGLLAVGGDLSPERLLLAYAQGIFPWPSDGMPLLWFSPDPRFVLAVDDGSQAQLGPIHLPRSLAKRMRRGDLTVRADSAFDRVIRACSLIPRPGQDGTWITPDMVTAYERLHALGYAHSIEAFDARGALVGGLYGVSLGGAYFGESMFSDAPDASKVAFATFLANARAWGFAFVDCQVPTAHLARFGARAIRRAAFLDMLTATLERETRVGPWTLSIDPAEAARRLSE